MRIDGQTQPTDAEAARRLESATAADKSSGPHAPRPVFISFEGVVHDLKESGVRLGSSANRVEVSSDAQLVAAAIRAAEEASAIRPEAVECARRALEDGTRRPHHRFTAGRVTWQLRSPR
jgi:hypothetical protein